MYPTEKSAVSLRATSVLRLTPELRARLALGQPLPVIIEVRDGQRVLRVTTTIGGRRNGDGD